MFLFKAVFFKNSRNSQEVNGLRHICIFVVSFYPEAWFKAPDAIKAPNHDLTLLQALVQFESDNAATSKAAIAKLKLHLWYLNEQLAALFFFDSTVSLEVEKKMVQAIHERESTTMKDMKRINMSSQKLESINNVDISHFITKESVKLFEMCDLPYDFLLEDPEKWEENISYKECLTVFKNLWVVNDAAERAVSLSEQYSNILSKDKQTKQNILQVVTNERKTYPQYRKTDFSNSSNHPGTSSDFQSCLSLLTF